ncbi:MAG TPA: large-conductance mechanosensitive channel protein MscL [Burkholderiales bacterium]|nr:large-conductance mechanosensitive channel protein MscL [Burkholderiales bacterium]
MSWLKEFREFATRGNVVDLAVGVIIGTAFGKIVSSLVADIIMPLIGILIGGIHYEDLVIEVGDAQVTYGKFIENVIDFVVIAFVIFVMVKVINRFRRQEQKEPQAAPPPRQEQLLEEIRDLLKRK